MKVRIFLFLLEMMAKKFMSPAQAEEFAMRMRVLRWNQLRANFPDLWDRFSQQFEEARASRGATATESSLAGAAISGTIERYPDSFEYFRLRLYEQGVTFPPDAATGPSDPGGVSSEEISTVDDDGSFIDMVAEFLSDFFS